MKNHLPYRKNGLFSLALPRRSVSSTIKLIIIISIIILASLDNLICWRISTLMALSLWLLSKQISRIHKRREDKMRLDGMAQLSKFVEFGQLSSGLFHDLVSPLSAIVLTLEEIEKNTHPEIDGIKDKLERSVMASKRMNCFMNSIKKRIQSDTCREVFSAESIIKENIDLFKYKALRNQVNINSNIEQDSEIFGNPMRFNQIISNLLSNAIDAYKTDETNETDSNQLQEEFPKKEILITLKKQRGRVAVIIEDWGSGIDSHIMKKIFEPFFTTKSKDTGTGLGLWITQEIVKSEFNGSIKVKSTKGIGTKFKIIMPQGIHNNQQKIYKESSTKIVLCEE